VIAVSPFRTTKAKRSAWFVGLQFDNLQKQNIPQLTYQYAIQQLLKSS
jgi:hypothetical protein